MELPSDFSKITQNVMGQLGLNFQGNLLRNKGQDSGGDNERGSCETQSRGVGYKVLQRPALCLCFSYSSHQAFQFKNDFEFLNKRFTNCSVEIRWFRSSVKQVVVSPCVLMQTEAVSQITLATCVSNVMICGDLCAPGRKMLKVIFKI